MIILFKKEVQLLTRAIHLLLLKNKHLIKKLEGPLNWLRLLAIFNHKDDKKGHHDIFRYWWWEHVGIPFTFPDTSNNRFQSYCDAAAVLILYSYEFINIIEHLCINKKNSTLNHIETNI